MKLQRMQGESNYSFLYRIYNDYGHTNLAISSSKLIGGEMVWLGKYYFKDLIELPRDRWLKKTYSVELGRPLTVWEYIEAATHRTTMDIEVMIDVDDVYDDILQFPTIKKKAEFIISLLRNTTDTTGRYISPVVHFTGNKSYHISYLDYGLRRLHKSSRRKLKGNTICKLYGDFQLVSENVTIALEGARHYRSGLIKKEVELK